MQKLLKALNQEAEANRLYYASLEASIVLGMVYLLATDKHRMIEALRAPGLTQHISNFIGSFFLMIIGCGKAAFRGKKNLRPYIVAAVLIVANIVLELSSSIDVLNLPAHSTWENFNVADPVDALAGIVAVLIVLVLVRTRRIPAY